MKLWHGISAFCFLMLLAAWLVYEKVLGPEAFSAPVALFIGWLVRQPVEMRKPPKLPYIGEDVDDDEATKP